MGILCLKMRNYWEVVRELAPSCNSAPSAAGSIPVQDLIRGDVGVDAIDPRQSLQALLKLAPASIVILVEFGHLRQGALEELVHGTSVRDSLTSKAVKPIVPLDDIVEVASDKYDIVIVLLVELGQLLEQPLLVLLGLVGLDVQVGDDQVVTTTVANEDNTHSPPLAMDMLSNRAKWVQIGLLDGDKDPTSRRRGREGSPKPMLRKLPR